MSKPDAESARPNRSARHPRGSEAVAAADEQGTVELTLLLPSSQCLSFRCRPSAELIGWEDGVCMCVCDCDDFGVWLLGWVRVRWWPRPRSQTGAVVEGGLPSRAALPPTTRRPASTVPLPFSRRPKSSPPRLPPLAAPSLDRLCSSRRPPSRRNPPRLAHLALPSSRLLPRLVCRPCPPSLSSSQSSEP